MELGGCAPWGRPPGCVPVGSQVTHLAAASQAQSLSCLHPGVGAGTCNSQAPSVQVRKSECHSGDLGRRPSPPQDGTQALCLPRPRPNVVINKSTAALGHRPGLGRVSVTVCQLGNQLWRNGQVTPSGPPESLPAEAPRPPAPRAVSLLLLLHGPKVDNTPA